MQSKNPAHYDMIPSLFIEHFNFGHRYFYADLLWIDSLQHISDCAYDSGVPCTPDLKKWIYNTFNNILVGDDRYQFAMRVAAVYMGFFIKDPEMGHRFFNKTLESFPNEPFILLQAAYHAYRIEKDNARAAGFYERAAENGAPNWTHALAVKLYKNSSMDGEAQAIYETYKNHGLPENVLKSIRMDLKLEK